MGCRIELGDAGEADDVVQSSRRAIILVDASASSADYWQGKSGRAELCVVPRSSTMPIELMVEERAELERRASMVTLPFRTVQRARMILYAAEGMQDIDIAARLDCSADVGAE